MMSSNNDGIISQYQAKKKFCTKLSEPGSESLVPSSESLEPSSESLEPSSESLEPGSESLELSSR